MKAVVWHGKRDVRVDNVPDPILKEPTDAIIRVTSTAICGSDLHLYDPLSPLMEEVGPQVEHIKPGDRVVSNQSAPGGPHNPDLPGSYSKPARLLRQTGLGKPGWANRVGSGSTGGM